MRTSIELFDLHSPVLGVAGAYVQAPMGLKALARASITFSTPGIGRARLFAKGGGPVSDQSRRMEGEGGAELSILYRENERWLARSLKRRFGDQDIEDLAQETWLRLASAVSLSDIRHPKAFLLRIATNLASTRRRRRELAMRAEAVVAVRDCIDADQTDRVMLIQIVLGLPESLRDVFLLSRIDGLTNAQIADRLGISPKTVEWRMTRALAHCAAQLRR
ncbi:MULTISPECIES: RNA polymerase sigma factor [unclassified Brevundimonas]